jgi:hypothetical protein
MDGEWKVMDALLSKLEGSIMYQITIGRLDERVTVQLLIPEQDDGKLLVTSAKVGIGLPDTSMVS